MGIQIEMGTTAQPGSAPGPALMDVEELLATRLLVQGNSGSGKSYLLRRLLEQSAPHVQQVIIDPEGDFVTLSDEFGHVVVDGARPAADLEQIAERIRQKRVSAVLNMEKLDAEEQMKAAAVFINALFDADRDYWYPMLVVVDEAQLFAPAASGEVSDEARKLSLGAMTNLMCRGRKRGMAGIIATQRLAKLAKNVAAEASNFLMGRTFLDIDMARAADLLGLNRQQAEMFRDLQKGNFIALGPALSRRPLPIKIGPVITKIRGGTPTLTPPPVASSEEELENILAPAPVVMRAPRERRPLPPPPPSTNEVLAQIVANRPASEQASNVPEMDPAEREAKIEEIFTEMMADPEASYRTDAELYQDFGYRCRFKKIGGEPMSLPAFKQRLIVARAGVSTSTDEANGEKWEEAKRVTASLPEDVQGVYLLLAKAAMERKPCPSNYTIARVCGSHSPGRAQRFLANMEKNGHIVTKAGIRNLRIIALPDLSWETAPGDPNAPDTGFGMGEGLAAAG